MAQFKYRMMGRRKCARVREIAREAYLRHDSQDAMVADATRRVRQQFDSILVEIFISVLIQLAIDLIVRWIEQKLGDPGTEYQPTEPGYISP